MGQTQDETFISPFIIGRCKLWWPWEGLWTECLAVIISRWENKRLSYQAINDRVISSLILTGTSSVPPVPKGWSLLWYVRCVLISNQTRQWFILDGKCNIGSSNILLVCFSGISGFQPTLKGGPVVRRLPRFFPHKEVWANRSVGEKVHISKP